MAPLVHGSALGNPRAQRGVAVALLLLLALFAPPPSGAAFARRINPASVNPPIEVVTHAVVLAGHSSGMIVDEQTDRIFVATSENVTMIDAASGVILAVLPAPGATGPGRMASIGLDARHDRVFVARGATVTVLNAVSGHPLRTLVLAHASGGLVVDAARDRVLIFDCGTPGTVTLLDATSGALLRTQPSTAGGCRSQPMLDTATDRVFLLTAIGLAVFDANTGKLQGTVPIVGPTDMRVAAHQSRIFVLSGVGGYNPKLVMLDARTLQVLRRVSYGPFQIPVTLGGFLGIDEARHRVVAYLLSPLGLQVLDTVTGKGVPTAAVADLGATAGAIDPATGYLYAACLLNVDSSGQPRLDNGRLDVLDIQQGRTVAVAKIGYGPIAVAVSKRAHRAFVLVAASAAGLGQVDERHGELDILSLLPAQR